MMIFKIPIVLYAILVVRIFKIDYFDRISPEYFLSHVTIYEYVIYSTY